MALRIAVSATLIVAAFGHSFLTVPMPISNVVTCRIGGNPGFEAECGGPCPSYDFREDMRPENPAATWARGQTVPIHWAKNNHQGGFVRMSIVPIDEMNDKSIHDMAAFYYGCWSAQGYSCDEKERHRDCGFDRQNLAWKTEVTIPTIYPDGVYVLGWTWYGGGEAFASFGDYYDCSFIRIRGGPLTDTATAIFRPGPRYSDGCQASVDRLGICHNEPCGRQLWSRNMRPAEMAGGGAVLQRQWYETALQRPHNNIRVPENLGFGIHGFSLYDSGNEMKLERDLSQPVNLDGIRGISIVPEIFGQVDRVEWFFEGRKEFDAFQFPFSIGGQQRAHSPSGYNFFDWPKPLINARAFVTAIAYRGSQRTYYGRDLWFWRS